MYKRILVLVEEHDSAMVTVREGLALARPLGSTLYFLHLLPTYPLAAGVAVGGEMAPIIALSEAEHEQQSRQRAERLVARAKTMAERAGVMCYHTVQSAAEGAVAIMAAASKNRCGLILAATEGDNALMRMLTGSVLPKLITIAQVPVLICRDRNTGPDGFRDSDDTGAPAPRRTSRTLNQPRGPIQRVQDDPAASRRP